MPKNEVPLVTVVTPSYNQVQYLEQTIRSVLGQGYPSLEYFIIDGGSQDGSLDIIQRYQDQLSYWVSEPDLGQTDAINKGFDRARGDFLAWLNSDDTYEPRALFEMVDFFETHPEVGMVYGSTLYIDETGTPVGQYPARQTSYRGLRQGVNTISQQAMFFRSKLWDMVGPLDPTFYYAMDYDLWVRIAQITPIAFHDRHWANFRLQSASKSLREAYRCWPEMIRVHFRDGGRRISVLYAKYLIRRLVEPIMPLRMELRKVDYWLRRTNRRNPGGFINKVSGKSSGDRKQT